MEAARRLGLLQVPCIHIDHLSDDEQRLLRLAVNRLGEKGRWDLNELKVEFGELILNDVQIEVSGFTVDEIDQIVVDNEPSAVEAGALARRPPAPPPSRSLAMSSCLGAISSPAATRQTLKCGAG